jgi:hypothetical protein
MRNAVRFSTCEIAIISLFLELKQICLSRFLQLSVYVFPPYTVRNSQLILLHRKCTHIHNKTEREQKNNMYSMQCNYYYFLRTTTKCPLSIFRIIIIYMRARRMQISLQIMLKYLYLVLLYA